MAGLLQLFPKDMRAFWTEVDRDAGHVQEIRLRARLPALVIREGEEFFLTASGGYTRELMAAYVPGEEEISQILQHICHYSPYAYEDELKQGFLTVTGGHRIGVAGQVVLEDSGHLRTIKHIVHLNIRLSHEVKGAADPVLPFLYQDGELLNTLLISPPGCGKTTLLRDMVRQISNGNAFGEGRCVGVVDERSEIAGCCQGIPQNDVGIRTDVLDACPKALGMMLLLRAMSPQVIAIDELGGEEDYEALRVASSCGCGLLATVHGKDLQDLSRKKNLAALIRDGIFQRIFILGKRNGRCAVLDMQ